MIVYAQDVPPANVPTVLPQKVSSPNAEESKAAKAAKKKIEKQTEHAETLPAPSPRQLSEMTLTTKGLPNPTVKFDHSLFKTDYKKIGKGEKFRAALSKFYQDYAKAYEEEYFKNSKYPVELSPIANNLKQIDKWLWAPESLPMLFKDQEPEQKIKAELDALMVSFESGPIALLYSKILDLQKTNEQLTLELSAVKSQSRTVANAPDAPTAAKADTSKFSEILKEDRANVAQLGRDLSQTTMMTYVSLALAALTFLVASFLLFKHIRE